MYVLRSASCPDKIEPCASHMARFLYLASAVWGRLWSVRQMQSVLSCEKIFDTNGASQFATLFGVQ